MEVRVTPESQEKNRIAKVLTAALYEAGVKIDQITLLLARYNDGATLQAIGDELGVTRERVRQLVEKYLRKLRQPDILRYFDCGIEGIPEKTVKAVVKRLQENDWLSENN